jgi:hypothetical protein
MHQIRPTHQSVKAQLPLYPSSQPPHHLIHSSLLPSVPWSLSPLPSPALLHHGIYPEEEEEQEAAAQLHPLAVQH